MVASFPGSPRLGPGNEATNMVASFPGSPRLGPGNEATNMARTIFVDENLCVGSSACKVDTR